MDHQQRHAHTAGTLRLRWATFLVLSLLLAASLNSPSLKNLVCQWAARNGLGRLYVIGIGHLTIGHLSIGHPLLHVAAFAAAGTLLFLTGPSAGRIKASTALLLTIAVGSEVLQHLVYRVGLEWDDIGYDLAGIAIALLLSGPLCGWKIDWFWLR